MCAGFYALGALAFVIFGSAKEQPWAKDPSSQEIVVVQAKVELEGLENPGFHCENIPLDTIASTSDNSSDSGVWVTGKQGDLKPMESDSVSLDMFNTDDRDGDDGSSYIISGITFMQDDTISSRSSEMSDSSKREIQAAGMYRSKEDQNDSYSVSQTKVVALEDIEDYKHTGDDLHISHM